MDIIVHRKYGSFGYGGSTEVVAESEEFVFERPYHTCRYWSHVHDIEQGFEDFGIGIDLDG